MASPQVENGHIDIANEIAEQFCRYRISGEEWMVLWAIIRKTYGWKKKEDRIALSQFAVMTGLKKPHIVRALRKLQSKRIIVIKNDTTDINSYRFNKDFDKWESLSKKIPSYFKESSLKPFCYLCGFSDAIEEHHINLRSDGGSDRVENKIILCPNCHTLVHKGKYTPEFLRTKKDTTEKTIIKIDNPINEIGVSKKIHTKDTTKDTITKEKPPISPKNKNEEIILPEWLSKELWEQFKEHRKIFKPKLSHQAEQLNLNKLIDLHNRGHDPKVIIEEAIAHGWKSFYEPKNKPTHPLKGKFSDKTIQNIENFKTFIAMGEE